MTDSLLKTTGSALLIATLLLAGCDVDCPQFRDGQFVKHKPTGETVMVDFVDFRIEVIFADNKFPKTTCACDQLEALP